jgi:hypothetical protein
LPVRKFRKGDNVNDNAPAKNREVAKTTLTYTMVHPAGLSPEKMRPEDIAYHLGDGEFVGARTSIVTEPLADEAVDPQLAELGGTPGYFAVEDDGLTRS